MKIITNCLQIYIWPTCRKYCNRYICPFQKYLWISSNSTYQRSRKLQLTSQLHKNCEISIFKQIRFRATFGWLFWILLQAWENFVHVSKCACNMHVIIYDGHTRRTNKQFLNFLWSIHLHVLILAYCLLAFHFIQSFNFINHHTLWSVQGYSIFLIKKSLNFRW